MRKQSASSQHETELNQQKALSFLGAFDKLICPSQMDKAVCYDKSPRGRPAVLTVATLIKALVFHMVLGAGTLVEHLALLSKLKMSGSSISERRQALPWQIFDRILERALRPVAQEDKHPQAFYRGLRLVAIDGSQFSLLNTAQILKQCTKAAARRLKAAFAKLNAVVMLEIGLHNPLAAAIDQARSEWALALELVAKLPAQCLLLADRLYGCGCFVDGLLKQCQKVGSYFLVRARKQLQGQVIKKLSDGSALVRIALRAGPGQRKIVGWITLREIWVNIQRPGFRSQCLRLWTNLLDEKVYPALELAALYARRWEQELYYRQMKLELRRSELLQSQTVETAAQEVAALVLATALIARERAAAANGECLVDRISFVKVLQLLQPLWLVFSLGDDILSAEQKQRLVDKFYAQMRLMVSGKRRSRSCPRAVRQPVRGWPRKTKNVSYEGDVTYKIK